MLPHLTHYLFSPTLGATAAPPVLPVPAPQKTSFLDELELGMLWRENGIGNWFVLLLAIFAGVAAGRAAAAALGRGAENLRRKGRTTFAFLLGEAANPLSLALLTLGVSIGVAQMHLSPYLTGFSQSVLKLLMHVAVFWYLYNLVEIIEVGWDRLAEKSHSTLIERFSPLIRKTLRVFVIVIAMLTIVSNVFKGDIGAWLAGLGIAGLAVSLAAQDTIKNVFGSITILLDRPFLIGEQIRYREHEGIVEEIGFRSTKVRTPNGHLVNVPSANIVNDVIDNISRRPHIRRVMNVTIPCDTPREKVRRALEILRALLEEPGLREPLQQDPPRVHFDAFNADSLNLRVEYRFTPPETQAYNEHCEKLNFRLLEEFEKEGIELAFPSKTLYLASDPKRPLTVKTPGS